jgi:hypothetical protein
MSSPGEQPPQFPVPSEHDALLAVLEHNELVELEGIFEKPLTSWGLVVKQERLTREREVENIKSYLPPLESPPYDPEVGPKGYIEQVRTFTFLTTFNHGAYPLKNEKIQIRQLASRYVKDNYPELWQTTWNAARLDTEELSAFFERNLRGIVLLPRMLGVMGFQSQKYKTVRMYMPDTRINDSIVRYQIRDQNVTREQIEGAKRAVMALRHTTPLPDFFQMQPDQQEAIVVALGAEWRELCRLTAQFDPRALRMQAIRAQGALAYHPVARLQEAIEQNPSIEPGKICRLFLRNPKIFETALEAARSDAERQKQLQAQNDAYVAKQQAAQLNTRAEEAIQKQAEGQENIASILDQDHARISITNSRTGEQSYYMPLDRGNALLAARVIAALQPNSSKGEKFVEGKFVEGAKIASFIWAKMPIEERELFLTRKTGTSSAIKPSVLEVMRKMTNLLGITRETSGERFKLEATPVITLHAEPPNPSELQGFRPVFPPGTDRERIKQAVGGPISEMALNTAKLLLEHQLDSTEPLSSGQALAILDLITDADVKRAIRYQIKEMDLKRSSANVLETLRDQIKRSLEDGFDSAWRNRMVAGNHATGDYGKIRLIGGELPIITNPARFITRKWHIGQPSD